MRCKTTLDLDLDCSIDATAAEAAEMDMEWGYNGMQAMQGSTI